MIIECVQRLAAFEHHVIRDVHDVADAADADFFQSAVRSQSGLGPTFTFADDARRVARTQFRLVILHAQQTANRFGFRVEKLNRREFSVRCR